MSIHSPRSDFLTAIRKVGLTPGLKLCLDAGHEASLPAASASWLDLSGGGYDFWRGSAAGADANDPTINGTAGRRSSAEFLSSNGDDWLDYDTTNETWMNNLHKPTGMGGVAAWVFVPAGAWASGVAFLSTATAVPSTQHGMVTGLRTADKRLILEVYNASGSFVHSSNFGSTEPTEGAWNFYGISWDFSLAGVNNVTVLANSTRRSVISMPPTGSYSSSNASQKMRIGTQHTGAGMGSGSALSQHAVWEGARPSLESFDALFNLTRSKYGT